MNTKFHCWVDREELRFTYVGVRISSMASETGDQFLSDYMPIARCRKWHHANLLKAKLCRMKLPGTLARLTPEMAPGKDCVVLLPDENGWINRDPSRVPAMVREVSFDPETGIKIGDVLEQWVTPAFWNIGELE